MLQKIYLWSVKSDCDYMVKSMSDFLNGFELPEETDTLVRNIRFDCLKLKEQLEYNALRRNG